jgi:glutamate/tyrosine decarboxylase-like PLP-dependent enzyme
MRDWSISKVTQKKARQVIFVPNWDIRRHGNFNLKNNLALKHVPCYALNWHLKTS